MTLLDKSSFCTRIYLIRHGDTVDELTKKVYKGTIDIPLSSTGVARVNKTAGQLSQARLDIVYTSALSRAIESGKIIAAAHDLDVHIESAFNEISFGKWEGMSFDEIQKHYPEDFDLWLHDPLEHTPPDGEPLKVGQDRIISSFYQIIDNHRGLNIAIVSHAGVLKIILATLLEAPLSRMHTFSQDYGCIDIIDIYDDNNAVIRLLNLTSEM